MSDFSSRFKMEWVIKMKRMIADLHTHTIASGHAYGTIREMAQAASEKDIEILGITEHGIGIPGTCEELYYKSLTKIVPRQLYGVNMLFGIEANVLNDGTISNKLSSTRVDYVIAGIHCLCYQDVGKQENTTNVIECMKNEKVFFISHPDDDHTPLDYERLVLAAKENHVALEVNNSSFLKKEDRWNCVENYKTMCRLCQQYQVPIIVSSDAHDPSRVASHAQALAFLEETGFDEKLILNNDKAKLIKFLRIENLF